MFYDYIFHHRNILPSIVNHVYSQAAVLVEPIQPSVDLKLILYPV